MDLLRTESLAALRAQGDEAEALFGEGPAGQRMLRDDLQSPAAVGLVDFADAVDPAVITHPVVTDVSRTRLLGAADGCRPPIACAAVGLLDAAARAIDHQNPVDWPAWHRLTPHVTALLEWLAAYLDDASLETLLAVTVRTTKAERRSGKLATAEKHASLATTAGGHLGDRNAAVLTARYALGQVVAAQGRNRAAEQLYRQVFTLQQGVLGGDHPDTLNTRHHLATMIYYQGRYDEAESMYRQVLADLRRVLGDEHPATLAARDNLARVTGLQGRHREAEQMFREVLVEQEKLLGGQHPDTVRTRARLERITARPKAAR